MAAEETEVRRYICNGLKGLKINVRDNPQVVFENGFFETDNPAQQAAIERNDLFGSSIHFQDDPEELKRKRDQEAHAKRKAELEAKHRAEAEQKEKDKKAAAEKAEAEKKAKEEKAAQDKLDKEAKEKAAKELGGNP